MPCEKLVSFNISSQSKQQQKTKNKKKQKKKQTNKLSEHSSEHDKMEFKKIYSDKGKVQILHLGFQFMHNRGPQGPHDRSYFKCREKKCPAKLSTLGRLDGELTPSYHHHEDHNHRADMSSNIQFHLQI